MNLAPEIWILIGATLCIGLLLGWLLGRLQAGLSLRTDRDRLLQQSASLEAELAAERKAGQEKIRLLEENRQQTEQAFQVLSAEALASNNRAFLDLAKATLDGYQQQARGDLELRQQAINRLMNDRIKLILEVDTLRKTIRCHQHPPRI